MLKNAILDIVNSIELNSTNFLHIVISIEYS